MTRSSSRPVPDGQSAQITRRQDQEEHLQRLFAYSRHYQVAHRWRRARSFGTFVLAAAGPLFGIFLPAVSPYTAALSAGWLVLGRTLMTWVEQHNTQKAVRVQELYDTSLFHLPWNTALAGRRPVPDDVATAARHIKDKPRYLNWYSIDLGDTPWPADVLLCQRQSAIWSRRDHGTYGIAVLLTGCAWLIVGVVIALVRQMELVDYLIRIFLPSAPALLNAFDLARLHRNHDILRRPVEEKIHDLWQAYTEHPESLAIADCREIQDSVYVLRRDEPRVPPFFYNLRKRISQTSTQAGTAALRAEVSP